MNNTLYSVYLGSGTDLLISKVSIVVNCYSEDTSDYQIFETTAFNVAKHFGGEIQELELTEEDQQHASEMIDAIDYQLPSHVYEELKAVEYIHAHATEKGVDLST